MSLEDSPTPFKRRSHPQGLRFSAYSGKVVCIWWSGCQETKVARDEEEQSRRSQKTGAKVEGGCKILVVTCLFLLFLFLIQMIGA